MRCSMSALSSFAMLPFLTNYRLDSFAGKHPCEIALLTNGEDYDRYPIVATQGHRGRIHDPEIVSQHPVVSDRVETDRVLVLLRIGIVDAVHAGALEQRIAAHFRSPER